VPAERSLPTMKLLITGVTGFIGGSIAKFAAQKGYPVVGIGKSERSYDRRLTRYIQADVIDVDWPSIIENFAPDVIFHGAGPASVGSSVAAPWDDLRESVLTWAALLEGIRRSTLNPLILFPSSAAVYGKPAQFPTPESKAVAPISPYGFHKAACELLAREYADCFKLNILILRFFSVFGPRQYSHVIWEIYRQLSGENPIVWLTGTGEESRDYLYIDDAVQAIFDLVQAQSRSAENGRCRIMNVGSGTTTKICDVAEQVKNLTAPQKSVQYRDMPIPGDPEQTCADIRLLRSFLPSWNPRPLASALADCVAVWKRRCSP